MSNNTYYSLVREFSDIMEEIELAEGEITDVLAERLTINKSEFQEKLNKSQSFIDFLESNNEQLAAKIDQLNKIIQKNKKTIETVEYYMKTAIKQYGILNKSNNPFVQTDIHKFTVTASKSVEIGNLELVPNELCQFTIATPLTHEDVEKLAGLIGKELPLITLKKTPIKALIKKELERVEEQEMLDMTVDGAKEKEEIHYAFFKEKENLKVS